MARTKQHKPTQVKKEAAPGKERASKGGKGGKKQTAPAKTGIKKPRRWRPGASRVLFIYIYDKT